MFFVSFTVTFHSPTEHFDSSADIATVSIKSETTDTVIQSESESDDQKIRSSLQPQATSLTQDISTEVDGNKQTRPTDVLMSVMENDFGVWNIYSGTLI